MTFRHSKLQHWRRWVEEQLTNLTSQTTAFGELSVESKTPQVQLRFPYNVVPPDIGQVLTNKAGSTVTVANAQAKVTCSATAESFSQIRTLDTLRYGPGQGAEFMGTCAFTTGVALSSQVFGPGDDDEGLYFGYNGADFGVMRRAYGSLEIRTLTITAGESTGAGNITITLDGTAVTVAIGVGDTIAEVCALIVAASADMYNAGRGWEVHTDDNVSVEFISLVAENASGTFSFADTDTTGVAAGTFQQDTTEVEGVAPTETWVLQSAWSVDKMTGSGPSGMTLDPTKGNVFKIAFQYLGYGEQDFYIEDTNTGKFQLVHRMIYANMNTVPWCLDPTFHLNLIAKTESGYGGGALNMYTASLGGFIQGQENPDGIRRSVAKTKTMSTTEQVLLILHNELDFNGRKNKITVYPDLLTIAHDVSKDMTVRIYKAPTSITGATALTDVDAGVSCMQWSITGTTVVGGSEVLDFEVGSAGKDVNLGQLRIKIRPGERYVFTGDMQTGGAEANIAVSWVERI
jgi:hypothetical protein